MKWAMATKIKAWDNPANNHHTSVFASVVMRVDVFLSGLLCFLFHFGRMFNFLTASRLIYARYMKFWKLLQSAYSPGRFNARYIKSWKSLHNQHPLVDSCQICKILEILVHGFYYGCSLCTSSAFF